MKSEVIEVTTFAGPTDENEGTATPEESSADTAAEVDGVDDDGPVETDDDDEGTEESDELPTDAVTEEMIAARAHLIAESGTGGSDIENWLRAESEIRIGA